MAEYRIRYAIKTASGAEVVNAIVTLISSYDNIMELIKAAGYRVVGVDERIVTRRMTAGEGWTEVISGKGVQ